MVRVQVVVVAAAGVGAAVAVAKLDSKTLWLGVRIEQKLGDNSAANGYATKLRRQFPDSPETRELESSQ